MNGHCFRIKENRNMWYIWYTIAPLIPVCSVQAKAKYWKLTKRKYWLKIEQAADTSVCLCRMAEKWKKERKKASRTTSRQELSAYVCDSTSTMQKIDAFHAAVFYCRTCRKCFQTTRDRWSWVFRSCLPLISPEGQENKLGQGNVCVCMRDLDL